MKLLSCLLALSPSLHAEIVFKKQVVSTEFVAEGAAVADFDGDGKKDIAAGPYIWFGPTFEKKVAFTAPGEPPDGAKGYSQYFIGGALDLNGDGKPDILNVGFPGKETYVFFNPGKDGGEWKRQTVLDVTDGESPDWIDVNGDGKPELVCHSGGSTGYAELPWGKTDAKGTFRAIAEPNPKLYQRYTHGQGAGDVNGDGRVDILDKTGWYEQPAEGGKPWPFHASQFSSGEGGAHMLVFDVNGDGRNDVVSSLHAHGYGLSWYEQGKDGGFSEHAILQKDASKNPGGVGFSQIHALAKADFNGDGIPDFVTGKRHWAHGATGDVDANAAPVLYWFETKRDGKGGAEFVPHEIDRDSGVGTQVVTTDLNGDGKIDVVVANKKGVFTFVQNATP